MLDPDYTPPIWVFIRFLWEDVFGRIPLSWKDK